MIKIKHFKEDRKDEEPQWKAVEKFLNEGGDDGEYRVRTVQHITAYPTGIHHNLILIYEEVTEAPA